jgi:hypothetical protein
MVKKGVFFYLVVSIMAALPAIALAGQHTDWGTLVIDGGDSQVYQVSHEGTPVWDAMDAEEISADGIGRTRIKGLQTWTVNASLDPPLHMCWFALGDSIGFTCTFDTFSEGDVRIILIVRGPKRHRERLDLFGGPLSLDPGYVTVITIAPTIPYPGYYTFEWVIRSRGTARIKGAIGVAPAP